MTIIQFIRLIRKNLLVLLIVPVLLAVLVYLLSQSKKKTYESSATFYTELASGYNVEGDPSAKVDYHATEIAFDNFINILNSRITIEDVAIKLFATHLILEEHDPNMISKKHYDELQEMVPEKIRDLVVKGNPDATAENLRAHMAPDEDNFMYGLLNHDHPHYSVKALSNVEAERIESSDLVKVTYESNDPGICRHTLEILSDIFIRNYSQIKGDRTKEVIAYFESQLEKAAGKLEDAEDRLLEFNTGNNIINYYEQTKFIADQKEKLNVEVQHVKMEHASAQAAIRRLESQLSSTDKIFLSSSNILTLRDSLTRINENIALVSALAETEDTAAAEMLAQYQKQSRRVKNRLETEVLNLHALGNTKEGLKKQEVLSAWLEKVIEFAGTKGSLTVLEERQEEFAERYRRFAPLGATLKRIERQISVSEREYLSILHSLGQARLKQQNIEMQSDVKLVTEPFFPITPKPTRRLLIVIAAGIAGFILVLFVILLMEYFDATLRYPERAENITGIKVASVFPRIDAKTKALNNFAFITQRLIAILLFHLRKPTVHKTTDNPYIILIYSMQNSEGKTLIARKLAEKISEKGQSYLFLNPHANTEEPEMPPMADHEHPYTPREYAGIGSKEAFISQLASGMEYSPDYILIELPAIIPAEFPTNLPRFADAACLVTRCNRLWSNADKKAQENIKPLLNKQPLMMLNGTEIEALESILGELMNKRSRIIRLAKKILNFQRYSRHKIQ
ncbi:MAG: hypothetical protein R6U19_04905 [Bacteroidales bacterium]